MVTPSMVSTAKLIADKAAMGRRGAGDLSATASLPPWAALAFSAATIHRPRA